MLLSLTISDTVRPIRTEVGPRKSGVLLSGSKNGSVRLVSGGFSVGTSGEFPRCYVQTTSESAAIATPRWSAVGACTGFLPSLSPYLVEDNIIGDRFTSDTAINAISMSEYWAGIGPSGPQLRQ